MLALSALNRASFESLRSCGRTITSDTKQSSRHRTENFDTRRQRGHALATSAFGQERSFKTGSESERHGKNPAAGCGRLLHRRIFSILGMCGRSDCQIRIRYRSWHCLGGSRVANRTSIFRCSSSQELANLSRCGRRLHVPRYARFESVPVCREHR
jgi:hypothetical protein